MNIKLSKSVNVADSVVFSQELTSVELGTYIRCKALHQLGTSKFSTKDLATWDSESVVASALEGLVELNLVVHQGGGWYALKRIPVLEQLHLVRKPSIGSRMLTIAKQKRTSPGRREELKDKLENFVTNQLGLVCLKTSFTINQKTTGNYRRIFELIDLYNSSTDEYLQWIGSLDWSWVSEKMPNIYVLGSERFIELFEQYLKERTELSSTDDILDLFEKIFGIKCSCELANRKIALGLKRMILSLNSSPEQFFMFATTLKLTDSNKTLSNLASIWAQERFREYLSKLGIKSTNPTGSYLERILERLQRTYNMVTIEHFENLNWDVAEAILEPLELVCRDPFLKKLIDRSRKEKNLSKFGYYFITRDKKFTPLAVYWIIFASTTMVPFYIGNGSKKWRETLLECTSDAVNLSLEDSRDEIYVYR